MNGLRVSCLVIGVSLLPAGAIHAQTSSAEGQACEAGTIGEINVQSAPVFGGAGNGVVDKLHVAGNWLHVTTRQGVVRRELLFKPGDCVDELRLSESERLLRQLRFIKSARIETTPRGNGTVDVSVVTRDDWSLRLEPRFSVGNGLGFTGISMGERNLFGTGRGVDFFFIDRLAGNSYGLTYVNPQWMKTRWDLALLAGKTEAGYFVRQVVRHPFVGLVGHQAAFQDFGYAEAWFRFVGTDSGDRQEVILPFTRQTFQIGGALRRAAAPRGRAARQGTYGVTVSYEDLAYGTIFFPDSSTAEELGVSRERADSIAQLALLPRETVRLNFLVGVQGLEFVRRVGLNTIAAVEDIAIGASADLILGLAAPVFGTDDSHLLLGIDGYAAANVARGWLTQVRGSFEGRRDYEAREWRDLFGALEVQSFWKLHSRHTLVLAGLFAAGWETSVPFQLTLGGPEGLRGYASHRYPGGARAVVTLEERSNLLSVGEVFDLGSSVFLDVGRMWANEAPFGTNSGLRASVGAALRLATPSGTRVTYQLEVAAPIDSRTTVNDLIFTLRIGSVPRIETRPPDPQLERSRDAGLRSAARNLQ